jgi:hypothetical protein
VSCVSDKAAPSLKGGVACNRGSPFFIYKLIIYF